MAGLKLERDALVGQGMTADVYAWGTGRVLKLFHEWGGRARAEREYGIARAVQAVGCAVPAVFELVEIDGRWGIVFERVDGPSMFEAVKARPWTLFAAARQMAELHAQLHGYAAPAELASQRQRIEREIEVVRNVSEADKQAARRRLAELPEGETLCHGDFHPANIILAERGPVIIDWSSATRGHALGDVACTSHLFQNADLPPATSWHIRLLFKTSRALLHATYLKRYLQLRPGTLEEIDAWQMPLRAAAWAWRLEGERSGGTA